MYRVGYVSVQGYRECEGRAKKDRHVPVWMCFSEVTFIKPALSPWMPQLEEAFFHTDDIAGQDNGFRCCFFGFPAFIATTNDQDIVFVGAVGKTTT